ncbi:hypothetical protein [Aureimonas sp. AU4]|uniref:hypothetical protein n=1 Tax=Aureimonas sp. AU4 TaxID=1638163 RepID=UPI000784280D|nr:hypothetical protein [Aureimonas sp. AU4]
MTNSMKKRLAMAALAAPLLAGTAAAVAQTPASAPAVAATPINQLRDMSAITLQGRVAEVYGNSFVIEDATGRALVDTGPQGDRQSLVAVGDSVSVIGRFDRGKLHAEALTGANGQTTRIERPRPDRDGPPGPRGPGRHGGPGGPDGPDGPRPDGDRAERRGGPMDWFARGGVDETAAKAALETAGYTDVALIDTKKHHAEFTAKDAKGAAWQLRVDEDNQIAERRPFVAPLAEDAARAAAGRLGYTDLSDYAVRGDHVEMDARDAGGRQVRIELNADGTLRKERLDS